jgi:hypothetical protein
MPDPWGNLWSLICSKLSDNHQTHTRMHRQHYTLRRGNGIKGENLRECFEMRGFLLSFNRSQDLRAVEFIVQVGVQILHSNANSNICTAQRHRLMMQVMDPEKWAPRTAKT